VIAWVAAAFLVMNAALRNWHGGAGFGPRYLIPAVPFLALPLAAASGRTVRSPVGEVTGPVSANPVGVYAAQTPFQARWNSFNLGEALWPQS
jgi:hypothetical protein